ncbi:MAG: HEAT repeat domain-containing protein [Acidobacteria bacterium]|nr:HEAT repeat domain-containing protein [Acidobacteriota bacterium]
MSSCYTSAARLVPAAACICLALIVQVPRATAEETPEGTSATRCATVAVAKEIPDVALRELTVRLLTAVGIRVAEAGEAAGACPSLTLTGDSKALAERYGGSGMVKYLGAEVRCAMRLTIGPRTFRRDTKGLVAPPDKIYVFSNPVVETADPSDDPGNAPFREAFWKSDFVAALSDLAAEGFGVGKYEVLFAALSDEDHEMMASAAAAVDLRRDPTALPTFVQALSGAHPFLREVMARELGRSGGSASVEPLIGALRGDTAPPVRRAAVESLGQLRDRRAVAPLIAAAQSDADTSVRTRAARVLGELGDPAAVEPLVMTLRDGDKGVSDAALEAVGRVDPQWRRSEAAARALPLFLQTLLDDDRAAREGAYRGLERLDPEWALRETSQRLIPDLIAALIREPYPDRKLSLELLLERIDPQWTKSAEARSTLTLLVTMLSDTGTQVRTRAAETLRHVDPDWARNPAAGKAVGQLIAALGAGGTPEARQAAAEVLGEIGSGDARAPLIAALAGDESAFVRKAAATALGRCGGAAAVAPLVAALRDADSWVRSAAIGALGATREAGAVRPLLKLLSDAASRASAIIALGAIGDARAIEPLSALLATSSSPVSTRQCAAEALSRIGTPAVSAALKKPLAREDEDARVRVWCAFGLLRMGEEAESARACLSRAVADPAVAALAVRLAGELDPAEATRLLLPGLVSANYAAQDGAVKALERIDPAWPTSAAAKEAIPILIAALRDDNYSVPLAATRHLEKIDPRWAESPAALDAVPSFIDALAKGGSGATMAAEALGRIGDKRAVEPLLITLSGADRYLREAVLTSLGRLKDGRATSPLLVLLSSQDADCRAQAARALGEIGDQSAVDPLVALFKDKESRVRQAAFRALERLGPDWKRGPAAAQAVEDHIAALKSHDQDLSAPAAEALGWIADPRATLALVQAMDHRALVLTNAADALVAIRDPHSVRPLIAKLEAVSFASSYAARVLGHLGDRTAVTALKKCFADPVRGDKVWCAFALAKLGQDDGTAFGHLVAALDTHLKEDAMKALGELGDRRAVEPLIVQLSDRLYADEARGALTAITGQTFEAEPRPWREWWAAQAAAAAPSGDGRR